ncbi:MAG: M24 family metallopeptidase [Candidatus Thorarchaeota archaeon]
MSQRIENIRTTLEMNELDATIAISPWNVLYFSGANIMTTSTLPDRIALAAIPKAGNPFMVVNSIEESFTRDNSWITDIYSYVGGEFFVEDPTAILAQQLKELGVGQGRLGIEKKRWSVFYYEYLKKTLPDAQFIEFEPEIAKLRMIKEPEEIQVLEQFARDTTDSIVKAYETTSLGEREVDIAARMIQNLAAHGMDQMVFLCLGSGENSIHPHAFPSERVIEPGDAIRVDYGGLRGGYFSDCVRMAFGGGPNREQTRIYKGVVAGQQAAIEAIKPGIEVSCLYEACKAAFKEQGVTFHFPHIGHGMGLELHELPMIVPASAGELSKMRLEEGMVLNIEPGYFLGKEGFHIEDLVLVTSDGYRPLTDLDQRQEPIVIK